MMQGTSIRYICCNYPPQFSNLNTNKIDGRESTSIDYPQCEDEDITPFISRMYTLTIGLITVMKNTLVFRV